SWVGFATPCAQQRSAKSTIDREARARVSVGRQFIDGWGGDARTCTVPVAIGPKSDGGGRFATETCGGPDPRARLRTGASIAVFISLLKGVLLMIRPQSARPVFGAIVLLAAIAGSPLHAASFQSLAQRLPGRTDTIVAINVEKVLSSPYA